MATGASSPCASPIRTARYKKHAADPRLMVPREPGEFGGEYYRLMPEGTLENYDGMTVTVNADPEGLDLNRNFPAVLAPGVRAGRRRARTRPASPRCGRWSSSSSRIRTSARR